MVRFSLPISDGRVEELLAIPGVTTVGEGVEGGQSVIVVGVNSPGLRNDPRIPASIEGVPVRVEVEGSPGLAAFLPLAENSPPESLPRPVSAATVGRRRPVPPGVSIGHHTISAGTSSFLATDGGRTVQLSNSHVLAKYGEAATGDAILQPGPADGGVDRDRVGSLAGHIPVRGGDNRVDLAWYEPEADLDPTIPGVGAPTAQPRDPEVGDRVTFVGRTSGVQTATVDRANVAINLQPSDLVFSDQFRLDTPLLPGDSGAPILLETDAGLAPAGVGFAATRQVGYANYISNVEGESPLSIVLGDSADDGASLDRAGGPNRRLLAALAAGAAVVWALNR